MYFKVRALLLANKVACAFRGRGEIIVPFDFPSGHNVCEGDYCLPPRCNIDFPPNPCLPNPCPPKPCPPNPCQPENGVSLKRICDLPKEIQQTLNDI